MWQLRPHKFNDVYGLIFTGVVVADEVGVPLGCLVGYQEGSEYILVYIPIALWLIDGHTVNN